MRSPAELFADLDNNDRDGMRLRIISEIFTSDARYINTESKFKALIERLSHQDQYDKLARLAHFYYFICRPFEGTDSIRDELRIVGITALIEALMEEVEYKDFFTWFEATNKDQNEILDYRAIKQAYLKEHGATRKIQHFFERFVSESGKDSIAQGIVIYGKKSERNLRLDEVAKFLYQMRSDFVHQAKMPGFPPADGIYLQKVGGKTYSIRISISDYMKIFERSFVTFWESVN